MWLALLACSRPAPLQVHVSIDDLPWQIERGQQVELPGSDVATWNQRLRDALAAHHVSASVFFNCDRLDPEATELDRWATAGHALGNHTAGHLPARGVGPEAFLADTATCQARMASEGHVVRWFRYPYLGYGADRAAQATIRDGLAELGLANVPVSAPTAEWVFAYRYRLALLAGDAAEEQALVAAYLDHMEASVREADRQIRALEGRSAPITVLLHANELNGDHLGEVLSRWASQGVRFVDVGQVMADPLYQRPVASDAAWARPWVLRVHDRAPEGELGWFSDEEERVTAAWPLPEPPWPTGAPPR